MTTRIKIINVGPESAVIWYYNAARHFEPHKDLLKVGDSKEIDVWDGHLPVVLPAGQATVATAGEVRFMSVPRAHY
jgi:hypothetical protein